MAGKKNITKFATEAELAAIVVKHFEDAGWEVYKEVRFKKRRRSTRADIVATRSDQSLICECKLQYSPALLDQARKWVGQSDYVVVAVPKKTKTAKGAADLGLICSELGIGVFEVMPPLALQGQEEAETSTYKSVEVTRQPLKQKRKPPGIESCLIPEQKLSLAGVRSGCVTPYKLTIERIEKYLASEGPSTVGSIVSSVPHHYKNDAVARSTLLKRLMKLEKGKFAWSFDGLGKRLFTLKKRT